MFSTAGTLFLISWTSFTVARVSASVGSRNELTILANVKSTILPPYRAYNGESSCTPAGDTRTMPSRKCLRLCCFSFKRYINIAAPPIECATPTTVGGSEASSPTLSLLLSSLIFVRTIAFTKAGISSKACSLILKSQYSSSDMLGLTWRRAPSPPAPRKFPRKTSYPASCARNASEPSAPLATQVKLESITPCCINKTRFDLTFGILSRRKIYPSRVQTNISS
mmetsp:Transcript_13278/g.21675  ORF Transcript_13278/g.21675 Transcript_13278/m.21675 type:complete len:224 (+) Transcript_13278:910-1581(+)